MKLSSAQQYVLDRIKALNSLGRHTGTELRPCGHYRRTLDSLKRMGAIRFDSHTGEYRATDQL